MRAGQQAQPARLAGTAEAVHLPGKRSRHVWWLLTGYVELSVCGRNDAVEEDPHSLDPVIGVAFVLPRTRRHRASRRTA